MVDQLTYLDFLVLVAGCEARVEARTTALEKAGVWLA